MSSPTREELSDLRLQALFRDHPQVAMAWAESQINAHRLLLMLEGLGWERGDRLCALQELHRATWRQESQREAS